MPTIKNRLFRYVRSEQLHDQKIFRLFVAVFLILAVIVWWGVRSSVQQNVDSRLENEVDRIEFSIRSRLAIYENSLRFLRVFFQLGDERAFQSYQELIEAAEIQNRYPGLRGVGVAALVKKRDLKYHSSRQRMLHKQYELHPAGVRDFYAPVVAFEPMTDYSSANFGLDLLTDPLKKRTIERAITSGTVEMTQPLELAADYRGYGRSGFLMVLPFYSTDKVPDTPEKRNSKAIGILYTPLRHTMLLEGIFGKPNVETENVDFQISSADTDKLSTPMYTRFGDDVARGGDSKTKIIELHGVKWQLRVTTLPSFYGFSDKYAPSIVALIEIMLISLVFVVLRLTFNQLISEQTSKEIMREAERNSQIYTKQLRLLNTMTQELSAELEVEKMADHFFKSVTELSEASHSMLYLSARSEEPIQQLVATNFNSLWSAHIRHASVQAKDVEQVFKDKGMLIRKSSESADQVFEYFFAMPDRFVDWVFIMIPSRERQISAVFFIAKEKGPGFSENVLEIVDSLVSQFGTSIENANLIKKTEDSNKAKSQFLANMSHEIRTPLNAIIGFSEMSLRDDKSIRKEDLIQGIKKNGQQLTRLIDDILDISKVEAGKLQIVRKQVSMHSILQEIKTVMEDRALAKGIRFTVDWDANVPAFIETDELRLKQIIFNVAGNAVKFTERGVVSLHVGVEEMPSGQQIKFIVRDTGIGIAIKDQQKLFRPFQQGDSSHTRRFGGTGLGLALSKKLAAELGGDLFLLKSEADKGSEFCILVFAGLIDSKATMGDQPPGIEVVESVKEPQQMYSLQGKRILVVEDSEDNQEIFEYFLKNAGADTMFVADGLSAVSIAHEKNFDLILMDIQLPSIDGKEATRRIRKNGYRRPIIALTAHAMPEERRSCLEAGCDGQISKPVSGDSLVKQVAEFLNEKEKQRGMGQSKPRGPYYDHQQENHA